MEKLFQLRANGTSVRTEILAGLTTFMTMAYIIALNPNLLTNFDTGSALWNGVFLATCIASALAMFCMAFLANKPFALAPGMGLNSFFAVVVTNIVALTGMSYTASFQAALVIILMEGIVFLILSILFRLAAVFRLTIPLLYALVVPTLLSDWYYAHYTLANVIWYVLLAVTVLSWVYSLVRKISAIMERRRREKEKEEILIQRVREAGRNGGGIVHIDDLRD